MLRRTVIHLILILLAASFVIPPIYADEVLVDEEQSLPFKFFFGADRILAGTELLLSGKNHSNKQQLLAFRLDNASSNNYRNRVNQEYSLPPGEFSLSIPLTGLKTSGGHLLRQPYGELFLFTTRQNSGLTLHEVKITLPDILPDNTLALDFGHKDSAVFPGFQQILQDDPRLTGKLLPRFRKSGDALVRDGIEGIEAVTLAWPNGRWKLSLWTEDQGDWEYLPHYLSRRVNVEGHHLVDEQWTVDQWIQKKYFAGIRKEAGIDADLWQLTGERRSGLIQKVIKIVDGTLSLTIDGNSAARYLSALVLEPVNGEFSSQIQQQRKQRFTSQWPVSKPDYGLPSELTLEDVSDQIKNSQTGAYPAAKNTRLNLVFEINSPADDSKPVVAISAPSTKDGHKLQVETRYGHWRYERPYPYATSLVLADSFLRSDLDQLTLSNQLPRRVHLQVNIPENAASGSYKGSIQLFSNGQLILKEYTIQVLPFTLPKLDAPIGLYLEPAPYYDWFSHLKKDKPAVYACDLSLLAAHGFSTVAPALATPNSEVNRHIFIQQLHELNKFEFKHSILAYAPFKRLLENGHQNTFTSLLKLKEMMAGKSLPKVYWSIFDEPVEDRFASIAQSAIMLHNPNLAFKTAGHLNHPKQYEISNAADLLLINHGYGVNENSIGMLQKGSRVWLYNMPVPRLAAGIFLWNSAAEGYLQWHGRAPTADMFDPTDGREGDVVYIYPWHSDCPGTISVHRRFLDLHEATMDYRWLQWLENTSEDSTKAKKLLELIRKAIPKNWKNAEAMSLDRVMDIRRQIIELAL